MNGSRKSRQWWCPALPSLALLVGILIWGLYFSRQYDRQRGLNVTDSILAVDLAQTALHLAEGEGLVTGFIRPVSLRFNSSFIRHPELTHPPLYIMILAAAIRLNGPRDITVVAVSIFFFWACLPWIWYLARKYFDDPVAALAILLYCLSPPMLRWSISGVPANFTAFLFLTLFFSLSCCRKSGRYWPAAAGGLVGLAFLTRYSAGFWILPAGFFIWLDPRPGRKRRLAIFFGAAVAVSLPWLIRNLLVTGNPFFSLQGFKTAMNTDPRPGYILWRGYSAQSLLVPRRLFFIAKKLLLGLRDQYPRVLLLTGNISAVFALTSLLCRFRDRTFDQLKYTFFLIVLLEAISNALFRPSENGLTACVPGAVILAAAFFIRLLGGIETKKFILRPLIIGIFLLICLIPISDKLGERLVPRIKVYNVDNIQSVCRDIPPDSILVSDIPWAVAWYGRVPALWLPYRIEDFEEIRIYFDPPIAGFYLTRFYLGNYFSPEERSPDWNKIYQSGWVPGSWDLEHRTILPNNQIYISRRPYRE